MNMILFVRFEHAHGFSILAPELNPFIGRRRECMYVCKLRKRNKNETDSI